MTSKAGSLARRLPPLPTISDILRMYGIRAKKNLSQNFILDPRINKKFANAGGSLVNKYVVEVGPGPGGITRALLEAGAKEVHVVEKDPRFLSSLQLLKEAAGEDKLHITIGDCLHYNPQETFPSSLGTSWDDPDPPNLALVGNLPFNVATPLLIRLLKAMDTRSNIYSFGRVPSLFTYQHEVALRMAAPPGDPERSRLSVVVQNWTEVDYIFNLPGGAFVPPPEVQVGIVKLIPLREPYITGLPFSFINRVVTSIFTGKQKRLKNSLSISLFPKKYGKDMSSTLLKMAGIPFDETAINLTMDEIGSICHAYKQLCEDEGIETNIEDIEDNQITTHDFPNEKKTDKNLMQFDIRL